MASRPRHLEPIEFDPLTHIPHVHVEGVPTATKYKDRAISLTAINDN